MKKVLLTCTGLALLGSGFIWMERQRPVGRGEMLPPGQASTPRPFDGFPEGTDRVVQFDFDGAALASYSPREKDEQKRDWLLYTVVGDAVVHDASGADRLLTPAEVNQALFDLPPSRHAFQRAVARYTYGVTRSVVLPDSSVVALLPKAKPEEQRERLARIADEQRKNLGAIPSRFWVFEYEFLPDGPAAFVRRLPVVEAKDAYSAAYGYAETTVKDATALARFIASVDDLSHVAWSGTLTLGGRRWKTLTTNPLRVEDVAALWQSEKHVRDLWEKIETAKLTFDAEWKTRVDEFNAKWAGKRSNASPIFSDPSPGLGDESLDAMMKRLGLGSGTGLKPRARFSAPPDRESEWKVLQASYTAAEEAFYRSRQGGTGENRLVDGSGFSLDPSMDRGKLADAMDSATLGEALGEEEMKDVLDGIEFQRLIIKASKDESEQAGKLLEHLARKEKQLKNLKVRDLLASAGVATGTLDEAIGALRSGDRDKYARAEEQEVPFLVMLDELKKQVAQMPDGDRGNDASRDQLTAAEVLSQLSERFRYQAARYDGKLQGTEVGMVMFYTDLLAKLWALDYLRHTPTAEVAEFLPMTEVQLSPAFKEESKALPNTRLWFGSEDNGFQATGDGHLYFAHGGTRVYAASSNPLKPGAETAPNATSEAFLGWWNDHYDDVADFEPEYERLNQAMKWTVALSWLFHQEDGSATAGESLAFLASVNVDRSAWFPQWAGNNPKLKFARWVEVGFYDRDPNSPRYRASETEALPLLESEGFHELGDPEEAMHILRGGVSGAGKDLFKMRAPLKSDVPLAMRRSGLDYKSNSTGTRTLRSLREVDYQFTAANANGLPKLASAWHAEAAGLKFRTANTNVRLRCATGELAKDSKGAGFGRVIARKGPSLRVEAATPEGALGTLNVNSSKNGFRIGWQARETDMAHRFTERLSRDWEHAEALLKAEPSLEAAVKGAGADEGALLLKFKGGDRWLRVQREVKPTAELPPDVDMRIAALADEAATLRLKWRDTPPSVPEGEWLVNAKTPQSSAPEAAALLNDGEVLARDPIAWKKQVASADVPELAALRQRWEGELRSGLDDVGALLKGGKSDAAMERIASLEAVHGGQPKLRLYRSLAELDAGGRVTTPRDGWAAARKGNEAGTREMFFDEIAERIRRTDYPHKPSAVAAAKEVGWSTTANGGGRWKSAGRSGAEVELEALPAGEPLKSAASLKPDDVIYVQRSEALDALDFVVTPGTTVDQVISQNLGNVVRLPRGDLATYRPDRVRVKTKAATATEIKKGHAGPALVTSVVYALATAASPNEDEEDDPEADAAKLKAIADKRQQHLSDVLARIRKGPSGSIVVVMAKPDPPAATPAP